MYLYCEVGKEKRKYAVVHFNLYLEWYDVTTLLLYFVLQFIDIKYIYILEIFLSIYFYNICWLWSDQTNSSNII